MNPELEKKWEQAAQSGLPIPIGDVVVCDICDDDYTSSEATGGLIFGSSAYCPKCVEAHGQKIRDYGEEHFIKAIANPGERFANFVRRYRGPDAAVQVTKDGPHLS